MIDTSQHLKLNENNEDLKKLLNSADFSKFLTREFPESFNNSFTLPSLDNMVFKSKDSFSTLGLLGLSQEWNSVNNEATTPSTIIAVKKEEPLVTPEEATSMPMTPSASNIMPGSTTSRDWLPLNTLGKHLDTSTYSGSMMFGDADSDDTTTVIKGNEEALNDLPKPRTDWESMYYNQLQLSPPSSQLGERMMSSGSNFSFASYPPAQYEEDQTPPAQPEPDNETVAKEPTPERIPSTTQSEYYEYYAEPTEIIEEPVASQAVQEQTPPVVQQAPRKASSTRRKRKRAPRKKSNPKHKEYVDPTDLDVLLGRGGRSNHHPGNKRYREKVQELQSWYKNTDDKDEKTNLAIMLVDFVNDHNGRFLDKDDEGWFEVLPIVARRKASQALREDNDPEKRKAKRQRFLKNRAAKLAKQQKN